MGHWFGLTLFSIMIFCFQTLKFLNLSNHFPFKITSENLPRNIKSSQNIHFAFKKFLFFWEYSKLFSKLRFKMIFSLPLKLKVERAKNRPFHCNICGKGFATESSLRTHTSKVRIFQHLLYLFKSTCCICFYRKKT